MKGELKSVLSTGRVGKGHGEQINENVSLA